ncbi:MAG TPA: pantoate--beta-alanine ligase [Planctomycetaceae bacterium]|nr:pantoate--beta-alanine ligase [Planctomycetaceae bacterium]HRF01570.1 pantoate--beta-alanine ligase [Pirellulaceae bacterium]
MTEPTIFRDPDAMRNWVLERRAAGERVGVVPTMGALHAGHVSLITAARETCDRTVATIFVNPTQFAPHEDLAKYPRTFEQDRARLAEVGTDAIFAPPVEAMYPAGFSTYVEPPSVAASLEGTIRPGHFRGVCTVVLKLFQIVPADVAVFGAKDFQQALVIRRMVRDLALPIEIDVRPTVREPDGLAMSSRNVYLSPDERRRALALSRALAEAAHRVASGERSRTAVEQAMRAILEPEVDSIDYAVVAEPESLECPARIELPAVALIAARVGSTRLIDNRRLD